MTKGLLRSTFAAVAIGFSGAATTAQVHEQSLSLHNLHTDEMIDVVYKRDGGYIPQALERINILLRDHRRDEVADINPAILDRLHAIGVRVQRYFPEVTLTFQIVSGYRSPQTNADLRGNGGSQAVQSEHISGNAIDFRIPGVPLVDLRNIAVCTGEGGTGYYARDGFIHIDSGRTRFWPGSWSPTQVNCAAYK